MQLPDGLYDKFVTESVAQLIAGLRDPSCRTLSALAEEEAAERISDALAKQLTVLLDEIAGNGAEKAKRQIDLVNALLVHGSWKGLGRRAVEGRAFSVQRSRFRVGRSGVSVRPDFIFPTQRVAIFVDGCFWHGCRWHSPPAKWLRKSSMPATTPGWPRPAGRWCGCGSTSCGKG